MNRWITIWEICLTIPIILSKSQNTKGLHTYHEWIPTMEWASFPRVLWLLSMTGRGHVSPQKSSGVFYLPYLLGPTITHLVIVGDHKSTLDSFLVVTVVTWCHMCIFIWGLFQLIFRFFAVFPLNHDRRKSTLSETNIEKWKIDALLLGMASQHSANCWLLHGV